MKVRLEENYKISIGLKIFYVAIILICIISVGVGIYLHIKGKGELTEEEKGKLPQISEEQLNSYKTEFNNIFDNKVNYLSNNSYRITKLERSKEIIYTGYQIEENKTNNHNIDVSIPYINIDNEEIDNYNEQIKNIFEEKAKNILNSQNSNTIYTVDYSAYIANNILSLIVRSTLKEGSNAQRDIIQTYNYNLSSHQKCDIQEILELRGITKKEATNKIREEIKEVQKKVEELGKLGYTIYNRDYESDIYNINNATEFFMGENNTLYIIYAYGNENFTSEIDIVTM